MIARHLLRAIISVAVLLAGLSQAFAQHISIEGKAKKTRLSTVGLSFDYSRAKEMKVWNGLRGEDRSTVDWQPYRRTMQWDLPEGEGKKYVSVVFKKEDGGISEHHIASIIHDSTPPKVDSLHIGNDSTGVTSQLIRNKIEMSVQGAIKMKISNTPDFTHVPWQAYQNHELWTLTEGDGEKLVYFKFQDDVGNVTEPHIASIILDTKPPERGILHAVTKTGRTTAKGGGWIYLNTEDETIDLKLRSEGAMEMMISNDLSFYGAKWQPYSETVKDWALTKSTDGTNYIYAKFRDGAGNESKPIQNQVVVDTHPPVLENLRINGGSKWTNAKQVKISLEGFGADMMKVGHTENLDSAEVRAYQDYFDWELELSGKDGKNDECQFFVQLIDSAQNYSEVRKASIRLDKEPPVAESIVIEGGKNRSSKAEVQIELKAEGASEMQYSLSHGLEKVGWHTYHEKPLTLPLGSRSGMQWVYARFKDEAGNISETIKDSLIIEKVPALDEILIDAGKAYSTHPDGKVQIVLHARNASEMKVSQDPRFLRAEWEPFKQEFGLSLEGEEGEKTIYAQVRSDTQTEAAEQVSASIIWDKTPPHDCAIELNDGEASTFSHWVNARAKAQEATFMQISTEPSFERTAWINYHHEPIEFRIPKTGGWKVVYARFKDEKGNISKTVSDSILMEIRPVAGKISINSGAEFCTDPEKRVHIEIFAKNAEYMKVSGSPDFSKVEWEPYKIKKEWALPGEDGLKTIYFKFKSGTETESEIYTDYIQLDRKPPFNGKVSLSMTRAGKALRPYQVYAAVEAEDAVAMQIGLYPTFHTKQVWNSYSDIPFPFNIGDREGDVSVYARFKDRAGNISKVYEGTIYVDRTKPQDTQIRIKGDPAEVNDEKVTLLLKAKGVAEMRIHTSKVFDGIEWEPYQEEKPWVLKGEDGTKEVYAQFRDAVGNTSHPVGVRIDLDRTAPSKESITIKEEFCTDLRRIVNLTLEAFGATKMRVSESPSFEGATWQRYKTKMRWVLEDQDGEHTLYVQFGDKAENLSGVASDKVILDREPPKGAVTIQNGKPVIKELEVKLDIEATGGPQEMLVSNQPTFSPSTGWIPYQSTMDWTLEGGRDGNREVYIRFRDKARNVSLTYMDSIRVDRDGPIVHYFSINDGGTAIKGKKVTLHSKVDHVAYMMVSNTPDFKGASWEPYFEEKEWTLAGDEGRQTVYAKYRDRVGNETLRVFSDHIMVYKKLFYISK